MPEIPKFRPPGPEPHFLIGNFPLGSRDPLGLLATWAHQFGDIFYYRAGWIHVYFLHGGKRVRDRWLSRAGRS